MAQLLREIYGDLQVLKSIWFSKIEGDSHKERLESFYGPQAAYYDHFRARFLHGRERLLRTCADKLDDLEGRTSLVWVDLGGGTGENVDIMAEYFSLQKFEKIYVVDICGPLCDVARRRVSKRGWDNVEVVEADVCEFVPETQPATLVTFSYSLTMIPPFMKAIDKGVSYLDPDLGILGVTDFYASMRFDSPERQQSYVTRWFWRCIFDLDNIDLCPERRQYLDKLFQRVYEDNRSGSIPYVPLLRAPYYVWLGKLKHKSDMNGH